MHERLNEAFAIHFAENFETRGELGASVCVWHADEGPIVNLAGGRLHRNADAEWQDDTLVLSWSCTKGVASAALLHALATHHVDLRDPVAMFWPEFAQAGKAGVSIADLLAHRAGLMILEKAIDSFEHEAIVNALARQAMHEEAGCSQGYHAKTYGYLLDEVVRRVTGITLGEYWRETLAGPLGLDFYIGLPEACESRTATIYAARNFDTSSAEAFYEKLAAAGSTVRRAFASPTGLPTPSSMNRREARAAGLVSLGGIGSARALAQFYAMLAAGSAPFDLPEPYRHALWMIRTQGMDAVLSEEVAFSSGFMLDPLANGVKNRRLFGNSPRAFGQPGAGGSHAFGVPEQCIGFAYLMNQMEPGVLPGPKSLGFVRAMEEAGW